MSDGADDIAGNERGPAAVSSPPPSTGAATSPTPLEYYSPPTPAEQRRMRGLTLWSIVLLGGWLPYVCGIVNAITFARSYNAAVTRAHAFGAVLFMLLGVAFSVASLIGFARMRHFWGGIASGAVLLVQLSIGACVGLSG